MEYITPDSIRVALPAELTMNLSPGALHFVSEDGKSFNLSAQVGSPSERVSTSGKHIVLEGNWPVVKGLQ